MPHSVRRHSGMNPPVEVSVIVPFLNAEPFLAVQLEALSKQTYTGPAEFIFSDNGSTDGGRALIESWFPRLNHPARVIDSSGKRGASHALNAALREARGTYAAFCDADDRVDSGWLECLVRKAVEENAGLVAGSTRKWSGSPAPSQEPLRNGADHFQLGLFPMLQNGNMLARRDLLLELGGWNEDYLVCEDAELSLRIQIRGLRIVPARDAILDYRCRPSLMGTLRQHFRFALGNHRLLHEFREHLGSLPVQPRPPAKNLKERLAKLKNLLRSRDLFYIHLTRQAERAGRWAGNLAGKIRYR
jgi:cellulose synthase/poly-beta-1,6-N-acetylglucosamine synthase-like glycosyltransferase